LPRTCPAPFCRRMSVFPLTFASALRTIMHS
jgi:hypothetical protein